jgi:ribonuclease HI
MNTEKKQTEENNKEFTDIAICYTDGSAYPNPGFFGAGCHGYIYSTENLGKKNGDKPNKYTISNIGYLEATELAKQPYETVIPKFYIDAKFSLGPQGTNNMAEVAAMLKIVNDLLLREELNLSKFFIKTDSMYLIRIVNNIRKSKNRLWFDKVTINLDYWIEVEKMLLELEKRNIKLVTVKVDGHSTSLGNNLADRMAYLARYQSSLNINTDMVHLTPAKKYWTFDTEQHTLLKYRQLFFTNNLRESNTENMYIIMNYKKDVEPGKNTHDALFGVVVLNDAPEIVEETIKAYQSNLRTLSVVSTIDLNVLYSRYNSHYYKLFGTGIYNYNKANTVLHVLEEDPVVYSLRTTGLATQALEKMTTLYEIMKEYRRHLKAEKTTRQYFNITNLVYEIDGKKVKTIIPNGVNGLDVELEVDGNKLLFPIDLGRDCISRNQLKQVEKDNTSVYIAVKQVSPTCYEYYTIVDIAGTNDIGVFCNLYTNKIYLGKK